VTQYCYTKRKLLLFLEVFMDGVKFIVVFILEFIENMLFRKIRDLLALYCK